MNEEQLKALQSIPKHDLAVYMFERTVVDLALEAREIINKILTRQYHLVDGSKLLALSSTIKGYTDISQGKADPHLPAFVGEAFVKFSERFTGTGQMEPLVSGK